MSSQSTTTNDAPSSSTHRFTADSGASDSSDSPNLEPIMSAPSESKTLDESSQPPDPPAEAKSVDEEPQKPLEDPNSSEKVSDNGGESKDDHDDEDEDDEEGECGFCLFMKGGGCKESFISWEKCIEEAEKKKEDIVEKCFEVTGALKKCMEAHSDYYEPVLRAEKAAEAEAVKELEKEAAAAAASEDNAAAQKQVPSSD